MRKSQDPTDIELGKLWRFAAGDNRTERDILCLMILFHTHRFEFHRPIFPNEPGLIQLYGLTQRGAAQVAADVWPDRGDKERTNYIHWYWMFNTQGSYECLEDVPEDLLPIVMEMKRRLEAHPDIAAVIVDDD